MRVIYTLLAFLMSTIVQAQFEQLEGFEGMQFLPPCWNSINADGDSHNWFRYDSIGTAYEGDYSAASSSWSGSALTPDNYLITPQLEIGDGEQLTYFVAAQDPYFYEEKYAVYVSLTGNNESDFSTQLFQETLSSENWYERTIDLASYSGMSIYLAFRHYDVSNQSSMLLDNINLPGSIIDCSTSINDLKAEAFSISPNPNSGSFRLNLGALQGDFFVEVITLTGKSVFQEQYSVLSQSTLSINTGIVIPGMYIFRVSNMKINDSYTSKIVIE